MASTHRFAVDPVDVPQVETRFRRIRTPIPAPGTRDILDRLRARELRSMHGQLPIVWDRASDFSVYDAADNKWIDCTSTIFVANVGHSNPRVLAAIREACDKPLLSCYAYPNEIRAQYLERLLAFAGPPFEKAFLLSAGTEATEAALKLMRLWGQRVGKRRGVVVCVGGNWHGRTMGAQFMSDNATQREWIGHEDPDVVHIPFPYPWLLGAESGATLWEKAVASIEERGIDLEADVCGFMLETFQGWGAVFYPKDFVQGISSACAEHGALLAFDEMQAGFGRTGKAFGYQHYDVSPDLICCGKGMGGGLPLSGVLGRADVMDLPGVGEMSSTHSANPLSCRAGIAVLDEVEGRSLVDAARTKGEILMHRLTDLRERSCGRISWVLGKGLIAAVLFQDPHTHAPDARFASDVAERCMRKGLLVVHTGRESIKLGPPLTISEAALHEAVDVLSEAIDEAASANPARVRVRSVEPKRQVPSLAGLAVPALAVGTFLLDADSPAGRAASIRTLRHAFDSGMTLVNTAHTYGSPPGRPGSHERLVGEAVSGWPGRRDQVIVTTKIGVVRRGSQMLRMGDPRSLMRMAQESASELGFAPDVTSCHRVARSLPFSETIKGLLAIREAGLAKHIGVSNVTLEEFDVAWRESDGTIALVEDEWSPRNRTAAALMRRCLDLGVVFLAWSPLGGSSQAAHLGHLYPAFESVARDLGCTPQQVALAWTMARSQRGLGAVVPIVGCSRPGTVTESARAVDIRLTREHLMALDASPSPGDSAFPDIEILGSRGALC